MVKNIEITNTFMKRIILSLLLSFSIALTFSVSALAAPVPVFTNDPLEVDTQGVPKIVLTNTGSQSQGIGSSQNMSVKDSDCCDAAAGTLTTASPEECLDSSGNATLITTIDIASIVPVSTTTVTVGYTIHYLLTTLSGTGPDRIIQQILPEVVGGGVPDFTVTTADDYTIQTLVAETTITGSRDYVNVSTTTGADRIVLGTTTLSSLSLGTKCASLDAGVAIAVFAALDSKCVDTDGDNLTNFDDLDDDNDGILDTIEDPSNSGLDTDGDGIPDSQDPDSDNDGCADAYDAAGDFSSVTLTTFLMDGPLPNGSGNPVGVFTLSDIDADGVPNIVRATISTQGQGVGTSKINGSQDVRDCVDCEARSGAFIIPAVIEEVCVATTGSVTLTATPATTPVKIVPTGYESYYLLANSAGVILQISADLGATIPMASFTLTGAAAAPGDYSIHTLVAETSNTGSANDYDLNTITATTTISDISTDVGNGLNGTVCGAIDITGVTITVLAASDPKCLDTDNDGIVNAVDIDDDNDGILDTIEDPSNIGLDSDSDGVPNSIDLDSDNDGIPDNVEAFAIQSYTAPNYIVGNNGLHNNYESDDSPTATSSATLPDTDNNGTPDYLDSDSDSDGISDMNENFNPVVIFTATTTSVGENGLEDNPSIESNDDYSDVNGVAFTTVFTLANTDVDDLALPANADGARMNYDFRERQLGISLAIASLFNDNIPANGCPEVGETITFTFTVENTGGVALTVPSFTNISSSRFHTGFSPTFVSATDGDGSKLNAGATWTYTANHVLTQSDIDGVNVLYEYNVSAFDVLVLPTRGTITSIDVTETEDLSAITSSTGSPCLAGAISIDSDFALQSTATCPAAGDQIDVTYTVENTGFVTLDNVNVNETFAIDLAGLSTPTPTSGTDTAGDGILTLSPGEVWNYTATYTILQSDIDSLMVNAPSATLPATVTGDLPTTITGTNPSATAADRSLNLNIPILGVPCLGGDLEITTTLPDVTGCPVAGTAIPYVFTVTNRGAVTLNTITITPGTVSPLVLRTNAGTADNELSPGEIWTYDASYTVPQTDLDNGSVSNTTSVSAIPGTAAAITNSSTEILNFNIGTCLEGSIEVDVASISIPSDDTNGNGCLEANETVTITYQVTNTGNVTLSSITLNDPAIGSATSLSLGSLAPNAINTTAIFVYTLVQADINNG
jgi:uncharacterized protein (UPF0212 family)